MTVRRIEFESAEKNTEWLCKHILGFGLKDDKA